MVACSRDAFSSSFHLPFVHLSGSELISVMPAMSRLTCNAVADCNERASEFVLLDIGHLERNLEVGGNALPNLLLFRWRLFAGAR